MLDPPRHRPSPASASASASIVGGGPAPGPGGGAARAARLRGLAVVVGAFAASRLAYALVGVRFDAGAIHRTGQPEDQWQLLDTRLLHHHLLGSLIHLHSQPPLYNLYCGLLLQLPAGVQQWAAAVSYLAAGVVLVAATYLLALELRLPVWAATLLALAVVASPAAVLYENWLSWVYPAASLVTVGAWCLARFLRTGRWPWGLAAFGALAAVVLDDSLYQWVWMAAVVAVAMAAARIGWRRVLLAAAAPLLVLAGWYTKDAVLFGTGTTSSWLGMNLADVTLSMAPHDQVRAMVRHDRLDPIALLPPFGPVGAYVPRFVRPPRTGVPALDERTKADGAPNFDNLAYVAVSRRYLAADLAELWAHPAAYARHALLAAAVWFTAPDEYPFLRTNYVHLAGYARLYDSVLLAQVRPAQHLAPGLRPKLSGTAPPAGALAWVEVLEYALLLVGAPVVAFRRRADRALAGTLAAAWLTVAYLLAVTSLVTVGENNRFSFELGALPLVATAAVVAEAVRGARRSAAPPRRPPTGRARPGRPRRCPSW